MRLRIPQRIRIGRSKWKIIRNDRKENWDKYDGLCFLDRKQIKLDPRLKDGELNTEVVFLHELLHAMWPSRICSDTTEERLVDRLASTLHDVLKKNPGLLTKRNNRDAVHTHKRHKRVAGRNNPRKRRRSKNRK